jgi:DNA-binding transcriptional LysR family regulator
MTLRHLRAFMAVAEELSFTGAARKLHISQPPLSRQIQQLEQEIGVKLFLRRSHGIELTDRGRVFFVEARHLSAIANEFLYTAQRLRRDGIGVVRIGTAPGLWKTVNRLRVHHAKRHPSIEIAVEDLPVRGELHNAVDALRRQHVDVALSRVPVETPSIESEILFQEHIVVLIRESHPIARARGVRLKDLARETLLMPERKSSPLLHDRILSLYAAAAVTPRIIHTQSSPESQSGLLQVAAGNGIYLSVASPFTQPHAARGVAEVSLDEPQAMTPLFMMWRKDERSGAVLNFVSSTREAFRT